TTLCGCPFVDGGCLYQNYVSVTKCDGAEVEELSMIRREFVRELRAVGKQAVSTKAIQREQEREKEAKANAPRQWDDTSKQIVDILDQYVRPAVASDGGNIMFESYEEGSGTVKVILQGACSGCPSSTFTLKNGIETMLKEMMGDKVREVVALNG